MFRGWNNSYSSGSSQEMEIDTRINEEQKDPIEESKESIIDKLELWNRDHFLNMFHNQKDFPNAYSIIKSKNLDWSPTKIWRTLIALKKQMILLLTIEVSDPLYKS